LKFYFRVDVDQTLNSNLNITEWSQNMFGTYQGVNINGFDGK